MIEKPKASTDDRSKDRGRKPMRRSDSRVAAERIERMEAILNAANEKLAVLETALSEWRAYQPEIARLEAYYTSADWKTDLALDEAGELPADLKRGVLSEDGIYNLLERNREALAAFKEI